MSKNLTRKGLALSALVALGSSVFAGTPAIAADSMVLAANTGTVTAAPVTEGLTLNASLGAGSVSANIAQLKYKIVTDGSFVAKAVAQSGGGAAITAFTRTANVTGVAVADLFTSGNAANDVKTTTYVTPTLPTTVTVNTLALSVDAVAGTAGVGAAPSSSTATKTATVTAFLDANNNGTLEAGETQQVVDVKFVKYSEITSTTSITAPTAGDTTVTAKVEFTNINNEQLAKAKVGAHFTKGDGTALDATATKVVKFDVAWSSTDKFKYTTDAVAALVKGSAVKVQPLLKATALAATDTAAKVGTAETASVVARALTTFVADSVTSITALDATALASATVDVLKNSAYQVKFVGEDNSTTPKGVAGVAVSVAVSTSVTLSSTKTLTVNGTTYSSNATLPGATGVAKIAATTDADGTVLLSLASSGLSENDTVTAVATAENFSAQIVATQKDAAYTTSYISNSEAGYYTTVDGTPVSVNVVVKDQFGGNAPDSTFDVTATFTSSTQSTTAATSASATFAAVVGGKVTLTITDNGTGTGLNVYALDLKTRATNGTYSATAAIATLNIKIVSAADSAAGEVMLTATAGGAELGAASSTDLNYVIAAGTTGASNTLAALSYDAFGNYDSRDVITAAPDETVTPVTVFGTVSSASTATYAGVAVANAKVTVAAKGMMFKATGQGTLFGNESLTVYASDLGRFSFSVASHLRGKQAITVTSGTGTATLYVYFAEAVAAKAANVAVKVGTGVTQAQAGRSFDVTFTVTDKWGNPVVTGATTGAANSGILSIASTGVGYLATEGKVVTGSEGTYKTKLITTTADLGTAFVTGTVDLSTDLQAGASVEYGETEADVVAGGRRVFVNAEFALNKTITITIDGKRIYSKRQTTDNAVELAFTQKKKGLHTVTVRISGGIVFTEKVRTN